MEMCPNDMLSWSSSSSYPGITAHFLLDILYLLTGHKGALERCQLADTKGGAHQLDVSYPFPAQVAGDTISGARRE